jgi:DNA-directed RNA polymerase I, II, and III subunit RPABC1
MIDDDEETYKFWKIRQTALQLCHDRGYLVISEELDQSFDDFIEKFGCKPSMGQPKRSDLLILVQHTDNQTDQLFVFFPDEQNDGSRVFRIGTNTIKFYLREMREQGIFKAIIISTKGLTPSARKVIIKFKKIIDSKCHLYFKIKKDVTRRAKIFIGRLQ